ncbi:MAG: PAS domain-containing sensor histidine kinase [Candidatus Hodarchaeales archaeon]|jgi:PAS domain S-box-containing protein
MIDMNHDSILKEVADDHEPEKKESIELKRDTKIVKQKELKFRSIIEQSTDIVSIIDKKGKVIYISPPIEKSLGWKPEELLFKNYFDKIHPEDVSKAAETFKQVISNKKLPESVEIRYKHKNGEWRVFKSIVTNLFDVDEINSIVVNSFDITERILMENALVEQNEEINLYLDIITHDLRNFHTTALGFLGLAELETMTNDLKHYINRAEANLNRSLALMNNIELLMKERLPYNYKLHEIELLSIIDNVLDNLRELYPERQIEAKINNLTPGFTILADSLFDQLVINLLTNSVKYDHHKTVKIEINLEKITKKDKTCILSFTDHARGIPPRERDDIFERFNEFRKRGKGSGLGLYIVKTLVDRYSGRIWIEDRVKDDYTKGTRFVLELECF